MDELTEKIKFYLFIIGNLAVDGLFLISVGTILSKVHNAWLPSLQLDGFYKQIIGWLAYSLDAIALPPLVIWLVLDFWKNIKKAFNSGKST